VEHLRDHADLAAGAADRLADVAGLDAGELLGVLLDECREPAQQPRAIGRRNGPPGGVGGPSARDRLVGLLDAGGRELRERLLRGRIDDRAQVARLSSL
jgi:hypothetical protein